MLILADTIHSLMSHFDHLFDVYVLVQYPIYHHSLQCTILVKKTKSNTILNEPLNAFSIGAPHTYVMCHCCLRSDVYEYQQYTINY